MNLLFKSLNHRAYASIKCRYSLVFVFHVLIYSFVLFPHQLHILKFSKTFVVINCKFKPTILLKTLANRQKTSVLKYKKSVFSLVNILGVFYLSYLPFFVIGVVYIALGNSLQNELGETLNPTPFRRVSVDLFPREPILVLPLCISYYRQFRNLLYKFNIDSCHNYVHRKMATHDSSLHMTRQSF